MAVPQERLADLPGHDLSCPYRRAGPPEGGRYFPALRRSLGVASQISSPLGGTRRFSSIKATPDFFREVR